MLGGILHNSHAHVLSVYDYCTATQIEASQKDVKNDEFQLTRTKQKQARDKYNSASIKVFDASLALHFLSIAFHEDFPYPFSTVSKQEVCYGLLFLQCLF